MPLPFTCWNPGPMSAPFSCCWPSQSGDHRPISADRYQQGVFDLVSTLKHSDMNLFEFASGIKPGPEPFKFARNKTEIIWSLWRLLSQYRTPVHTGLGYWGWSPPIIATIRNFKS